MNRSCVLLLFACSCFSLPQLHAARPPKGFPHFERLCRERGVTGCFVFHDVARKHTSFWNPRRCHDGFLPASTFKIWNTLIGIETGAVDGPDHRFAWDGVERTFASWNRDHTLRSAFQTSAVWYYQEVARRIGAARMADYLNRIHYGTADIGQGIDTFWLEGPLRITPRQQVELLNDLLTGKLPFGAPAVATLTDLSRLDGGDDWQLHGKTGWYQTPDLNVGWLVGWVERQGKRYVYALNVEAPRSNAGFGPARPAITRAMLEGLRALPRSRN